MKYILPIFLLAGCTSLPDLYAERQRCWEDGRRCDGVHAKIDRMERALEQREYSKRNRCPDGMIEYCDSRMQGCGRRMKRPTDEFTCISRDQMQGLF